MASVTEYIKGVLKQNKIVTDDRFFPSPTEDQFFSSVFINEINEVYKDLGGIADQLPLEIFPYDIQIENAVILIDNDTYYNRYRAITFKSPLYSKIPGINIDHHKRFCRQYESECLKSAGSINKWCNKESEKYFGRSQDIGDLASPGSSLWKLNAFKCYLTDLSSLLNKTKIFRLSPYDNLFINGKMIKIKELILKRNPVNEAYLMKYIDRGIKM